MFPPVDTTMNRSPLVPTAVARAFDSMNAGSLTGISCAKMGSAMSRSGAKRLTLNNYVARFALV
jgi:hypothetical protein